MSTTRKMFDEEMILVLVADLKDWPNISSADDDQELIVGPFVTIYFLYDTTRTCETVATLIDIHEQFEKITGFPYATLTDPSTEVPSPANSITLAYLREYAETLKADDYFIMKGSSLDDLKSSPVFGIHVHKTRAHMNDAAEFPEKIFSFIKFNYRWGWWLENKEAWRLFVYQTNEKLKPYVAVSGFAVANPFESGTRPDAAVFERALAPYFYGLDIDYPFSMNELGYGIRPPTWGFLLSDSLRSRLNYTRDEVRDHLANPRIRIEDHTCGQWIELDEQPSLFPVDEGVPFLPSLLNRLLRSVRDDELSLLGFAQWEDDPNERFTPVDAKRWIRRFDDDSDWPSTEVRGAPPTGVPSMEVDIANTIRSRSGQICPRTGYWSPVEKIADETLIKMGETMPSLQSAYGYAVWVFLRD